MANPAAAIIPAAGSGTRMNAAIPKQYLSLAGKPIIIHTITAFINCQDISQIIVVVPSDKLTETETLLVNHQLDRKKISVIAGGLRRQDSVLAGLKKVEPGIDIVLVHDGARPLITPELISRCYQATQQSGAAIAAIPVKDTLKKGNSDQFVEDTIDRSYLWRAQTPQGARKELLLESYAGAETSDFTDESSLLEQAGIEVQLVVGAESNIKITNPEDLELAERIMTKPRTTMRIGHGFDAHRYETARKLVLGGVEIDHHRGLAGHSDADVVTHALCDAILGALGQGDIGNHFPENDSSFKDILSLILLDSVVLKAEKEAFYLANADITVICQAPKLAPYIQQMREKLASCCKTEIGNINIKATTTEKMGFTGREEGISCHAVVLLDLYPGTIKELK